MCVCMGGGGVFCRGPNISVTRQAVQRFYKQSVMCVSQGYSLWRDKKKKKNFLNNYKISQVFDSHQSTQP